MSLTFAVCFLLLSVLIYCSESHLLQNRVYPSYCILAKVVLFNKHLLKTGEPTIIYICICINPYKDLTMQKKYGWIIGSPNEYLTALCLLRLFETSEVNKP